MNSSLKIHWWISDLEDSVPFQIFLLLIGWSAVIGGRAVGGVACREPQEYRSGSVCCRKCPAGEAPAAAAPLPWRRILSPVCLPVRHVCGGTVHGGGAAGDVSGMRRWEVHGAHQQPEAVLQVHALPLR